MRALLRPLLLPLLRRDPDEVATRAAAFRIGDRAGRELVARLGRAFIGGYNTMLGATSLDQVAAAAAEVPVHFRPFFFEGAAMGYLPRGTFAGDCRADRVERDLLGLEPGYRYLYYVGLGFWFGFRHRRRPERLLSLAPHLDPLYFPLCYDGYGFKLAFFDFPEHAGAIRRLEACPPAYRHAAYQGLGRGLFFVFMDDEAGFQDLRASLPVEVRHDLEFGRSLARGFTGVDGPDSLVRFVEQSPTDEDRAARLGGVTWALTARKMNDPVYFECCLERAGTAERSLLQELPLLCDRALRQAQSYADWQVRTRKTVSSFYDERRGSSPQ